MDNNDRLVELETRLAFQDRTIETLHEVILDLRSDLDSLRRELGSLEEKFGGGDHEVGPANELPPHW